MKTKLYSDSMPDTLFMNTFLKREADRDLKGNTIWTSRYAIDSFKVRRAVDDDIRHDRTLTIGTIDDLKAAAKQSGLTKDKAMRNAFNRAVAALDLNKWFAFNVTFFGVGFDVLILTYQIRDHISNKAQAKRDTTFKDFTGDLFWIRKNSKTEVSKQEINREKIDMKHGLTHQLDDLHIVETRGRKAKRVPVYATPREHIEATNHNAEVLNETVDRLTLLESLVRDKLGIDPDDLYTS